MPTDTTIIDRLREMANGLINGAPECWNGDDARAQVGWAQDMLAAADALTAAHAARDAAYKQQRDAWDRIGELHAQLTAAYAARDADALELRRALEDARVMQGIADASDAENETLRARLTTALRERDEARAKLAKA